MTFAVERQRGWSVDLGRHLGNTRRYPFPPVPQCILVSDANPPSPPISQLLAAQRVALIGRFAGMSQRELAKAIEQHGGSLSDKSPTLVVIGDESSGQPNRSGLPLGDGGGFVPR